MATGERAFVTEVRPERCFTRPPPRYTEASLVRRLEELGIGRPSTYASIVDVLRERGYVVLYRRRFVPTERGRIVTAFLEAYFEPWVAYGFTTDLEADLDRVGRGRDGLQGGARLILGRLRGGAGGRRRAQARRGPRRDGAHAGALSLRPLPGPPGRARMPVLRRRPASPQVRPLRPLRRLLELPRVPLQPAACRRPRRLGARAQARPPRKPTPPPA